MEFRIICAFRLSNYCLSPQKSRINRIFGMITSKIGDKNLPLCPLLTMLLPLTTLAPIAQINANNIHCSVKNCNKQIQVNREI